MNCEVEPTDTVAIWGAGPVGHFAVRSAVLLGANQVICIDNVPERLSMAQAGGAITINFDNESVLERLAELTQGKGPEKCIDAVGWMMYVCRPAGTLSIPGVYGGLSDKIPFGAAMSKGLTIRLGQTHVNRWTEDLLNRIQESQIDPSFVITHTCSLEDGPGMYKTFRNKEDGCIKVVLKH